MRYRSIPAINRTVSEVGLGTYALAGVYGKRDPEDYVRLVQRAFELGINYFDTAPAYGPAEEVLGQALRPFRREVVVATKTPPFLGENPTRQIRNSCERSLRLLGGDCIDLYFLHFHSSPLVVEEVVATFRDLQQEGKIRGWGVSHAPPSALSEYLAARPAALMAELSPVARHALRSILPNCRQNNVPVIAYSPVGRGILAGIDPKSTRLEEGDIRGFDPLFRRGTAASARRVRQHMANLAASYGVTVPQLAMAWVLAQPGTVCALSGTSSPAHLEECAAACHVEISSEDWARMEHFLAGEDERWRSVTRQEVQEILSGPLRAGFEECFVDLLYAAEVAVRAELVDEDMIVPAVMRLLALRRKKDMAALEKVRQDIHRLILGEGRGNYGSEEA